MYKYKNYNVLSNLLLVSKISNNSHKNTYDKSEESNPF